MGISDSIFNNFTCCKPYSLLGFVNSAEKIPIKISGQAKICLSIPKERMLCEKYD